MRFSLTRAAAYLLSIFLLLAFILGWITVFAAANELRMLATVQDWPSGRGKISQSAPHAARLARNTKRSWHAGITGHYAGTREPFTAARIGYGLDLSPLTRRQAETLAARFPPGTELTVFHEPGNPGRAILIRNNSPAPTWIALGAGLLAGLLPPALYAAGRIRATRP